MSKRDFLDELDSLCKKDTVFLQPKKKEDTVIEVKKESDAEAEVSKKGKKKGKNKKKSKFDDNDLLAMDEFILNKKDEEGDTLSDLIEKAIDEAESEDNYSKKIVKRQKGKYKGKGKTDFEEQFTDVLGLLYDEYDKYMELDKELEAITKNLVGNKTRGMSKYAMDALSTRISNKGNGLQIIKEISATKKKIADLQLALDKTKVNVTDDEFNPENIASAYFSKIQEMGRNNFINQLNSSQSLEIPPTNYNDVDYTSIESEEEMPDLDDVLNERDDIYRDEEQELRIKYENVGAKVVVIRNPNDMSWYFAALDKDDNVIEDYPLPDPDTCGTVRFSKDGTRMMDGNGESYKVYEDNNMDESYLDDYEYFDGIEDED